MFRVQNGSSVGCRQNVHIDPCRRILIFTLSVTASRELQCHLILLQHRTPDARPWQLVPPFRNRYQEGWMGKTLRRERQWPLLIMTCIQTCIHRSNCHPLRFKSFRKSFLHPIQTHQLLHPNLHPLSIITSTHNHGQSLQDFSCGHSSTEPGGQD